MANPNPVQSEAFKAQQIPKYGDRALSKRVVGTRYPEAVDAILKTLSSEEAQRLIRTAVEQELIARGLLNVPEQTASEEKEKPPRSRRSVNKKPAPKSKQEFKAGQMVKNPADWRGWITKLLDDGRAVVDWEGQIKGDVIPLHLLKPCE